MPIPKEVLMLSLSKCEDRAAVTAQRSEPRP